MTYPITALKPARTNDNVTSLDRAWDDARILFGRDVNRQDFYHGARAMMTLIIDDICAGRDIDELAETVLRLNNELHSFGNKTP